MRIAQVSPLFEAVPPRLYGGTERIVYNLTEALVREGHEVTLYASGDSLTSARLRSNIPQALRLLEAKDWHTPHTIMFERIRRELEEYDLVHFHTESMHLNAMRSMNCATVSTMHGRLDLPQYQALFREFSDVPLVSISKNQERPLPFANWVGSVHHGLLAQELNFHSHAGEREASLRSFDGADFAIEKPREKYVAFIGRLCREKRVDRAIEITRNTGWKLKIAAKVEPEIEGEYLHEIRDLLKEPHVEFVGEINELQKDEFLGNATAMLFPIDWPEPFGLVMIESLAVGTPVIAFRNGSVPEVIEDGVTGFVVDSMDGACEAMRSIHRISRARCRYEFETRFSAARMARDYVEIYKRVMAQRERYQDFLVRSDEGFCRQISGEGIAAIEHELKLSGEARSETALI